MVLIALPGGDLRSAVGVGGFLVIMGLAFLINGRFESREWRQMPPISPGSPSPPSTPTSPSDPR